MVLVPLTAVNGSTRSLLLLVATQHHVQPTGGDRLGSYAK
jgi:hypothetical protein